MLKILKSGIVFLFFISIIYIIFLNNKLTHKTVWKNGVNTEVYKQLYFIGNKLEHDGAEKMQQYYPEGYFFSYVLYGLSWCDFLQKTQDKEIREMGINEINKAASALSSPKGRSIFPQQLSPEYGIFYAGWTNCLLAKKLAIQNNYADSLQFEQNCDNIVNAFKQSNQTFLASYAGLSWPCDNIVAVASLAMHDKIYPAKYTSFLSEYIQKLKSNLDKEGLIPHKTDYKTGHITEQAKGSSQSLLLIFLLEIDSDFAKEQFAKYKTHFLDKRMGLYGIREHKIGINGKGDIDSGPVIWDIGGSASVVGAKTFALFNETSIAETLRNSLEAFGMAVQNKNDKKYLFGQWLVADCFIAWSNASESENEQHYDKSSKLTFGLYSIAVILLLLALIKVLLPRKQQS